MTDSRSPRPRSRRVWQLTNFARRTAALVVAVLALFASAAPAAAAGEGNVSISALRDDAHAVGIEALARGAFLGDFAPPVTIRQSDAGTLFRPGVEWFRLTFRHPEPLFMHFGRDVTDGDVYLVRRGKVVARQNLGMLRPVDQRALHSSEVLVPLPRAHPGETVFVRALSAHASIPFTMLSQTDVNRDDLLSRIRARWLLIAAGMAAGIALSTLLLYGLVRDRAYPFFAGALFAGALGMLARSGDAWTLVWPGWSIDADVATFGCMVCACFGAVGFARNFLSLPENLPAWDRTLLRGLFVLAAWSVLAVVFPARLTVLGVLQPVWLVLIVSLMALLLAAGARAWRRGYPMARFYVAAFAGLLLGIVLNQFAAGLVWVAMLGALAISDRMEAAKARRFEQYALYDAVTGVRNRRAFETYIENEWKRAQREGTPLAVVIVDIDNFKKYNDAYGHPAGDACLRRVAEAMAAALRRPGDIVARYGGEEFIAVLPQTEREGAEKVAEAMLGAVRALEIPHRGSSFGIVTISGGVSYATRSRDLMWETLVDVADGGLYQAKNDGRNRFEVRPLDPVGDLAETT